MTQSSLIQSTIKDPSVAKAVQDVSPLWVTSVPTGTHSTIVLDERDILLLRVTMFGTAALGIPGCGKVFKG
jgi:hypothetical protein